jgi:hypothetical protein
MKLIGSYHVNHFIVYHTNKLFWVCQFIFFAPVTHSAYINVAITINNLNSTVNSDRRDSISSLNSIRALCFKCAEECSVQASISHTTATQSLNTETCHQLRCKNRCCRTYPNLYSINAAICWQLIKLEALVFIQPLYGSNKYVVDT